MFLTECFPLPLKATEAAWDEGHSVHSQQTVDCSFDIENTSFYFLHFIFFIILLNRAEEQPESSRYETVTQTS